MSAVEMCRRSDAGSGGRATTAGSGEPIQWTWKSTSRLPAARRSTVRRGRPAVPSCRYRSHALLSARIFTCRVRRRYRPRYDL